MRVDEDLVLADYPTDAVILDSVIPKESQIEEDSKEDESEGNVSSSKIEVLHAFEIVGREVQGAMNMLEDFFRALNQCEHFFDQLCASKTLNQVSDHTYVMILVFEV